MNTYSDQEWYVEDQDKVLETLVDNTFGILEDHYNSKDTITIQEERFKNLYDKYEDDNLRYMHTRIARLSYNQRMLSIRSKKIYDNNLKSLK
jgi:hypothetical protein